MWKCKHCEQEFDFDNSGKANHSRWCDKNPKKDEYRKPNSSSNAIEAMRKKQAETGFTNLYTKAKILGLPQPESPNKGKTHKGTPHTEHSKKLLSESRKAWLKNNPDKHPWKNKDKFKSIPCEKFKQSLIDNGISFLAEQTPLAPDHFYSVDICFPDKKIIIEINGNQHYNTDKTLKPYYQKRHELFEQAGWTIYEYHYSVCYDAVMMTRIIYELKTTHNLSNVDYSFYIKEKQEPTYCEECGIQITKDAIRCKEHMITHYMPPQHYINILDISREDLVKELETLLYTEIVIKHNITYKTLKSKIDEYKIDTSNKKYIPEHHIKTKTCIECGKLVCDSSIKCSTCKSIEKRKFEITKEELQQLVKDFPITKISKMFGVSDVAIAKRCDLLGVKRKRQKPRKPLS